MVDGTAALHPEDPGLKSCPQVFLHQEQQKARVLGYACGKYSHFDKNLTIWIYCAHIGWILKLFLRTKIFQMKNKNNCDFMVCHFILEVLLISEVFL